MSSVVKKVIKKVIWGARGISEPQKMMNVSADGISGQGNIMNVLAFGTSVSPSVEACPSGKSNPALF